MDPDETMGTLRLHFIGILIKSQECNRYCILEIEVWSLYYQDFLSYPSLDYYQLDRIRNVLSENYRGYFIMNFACAEHLSQA